MMVTGLSANAQTKISLNDAITTALENNNKLKSEKLRSDYAKAMIKTAPDLPQANLTADYGQINSVYNDTKFGISQSFAFPTLYSRQKQLNTEEWKQSVLSVSLQEFELKKAVTQAFYTLVYLQQKEQLLQKADTLYRNFYAKSELRLRKGESNVLEKVTAENQKSEIMIRLKQLRQELILTSLQFQLLLNTEKQLVPDTAELIMPLTEAKADISQNPYLLQIQQQKQIAAKQTKVERAKLLPSLLLGYNNTSFKGVGPDGIDYTTNTRFHSVQAGISLPVFTFGQRARVQTSKIAEKIAEQEFQTTQAALQTERGKLLAAYQSNLEIVSYYQTTGLKNADTILKTAQLQFVNGEINYLDFVMLVNQAISVQNNYADAVWTLNESIVKINYLNLN